MDFIINAMQLSAKKYIILPQLRHHAPSRAAVFLDLKDVFNLVSWNKLLDFIHCKYLALYPLTNLLYGDTGTIHFH